MVLTCCNLEITKRKILVPALSQMGPMGQMGQMGPKAESAELKKNSKYATRVFNMVAYYPATPWSVCHLLAEVR